MFAQNRIDMFIKADRLLSNGQLDVAEKYLIQMSNENPYNGFYHYLLGINYHYKSEYRKSITELRRAQKLGWQYISNYLLARNYISINRPDSAIYYLKEYIRTPFKGPEIDEVFADTIFKRLHNSPEFLNLLPPKISKPVNVAESWLKDISYLSDMLKKTHYAPYFKLNETEWEKEIEQLKNIITTLNSDQILVRICQFIARMGDAHTRILNWNVGKSRYTIHKLPFSVKIFSDGCYIIRTSNNYKELLGAKIIKINNIDFDSVYNAVCTLIPKDNEMWCKREFNKYFRNMNLLHGLGLCSSKDSLEIVCSVDTKVERKNIISVKEDNSAHLIDYHSFYKAELPMFLKNIDKAYWYKYIKEENILYVQINSITSLKDNPLVQFSDSIKALIDTLNISAFVLDIRNNSGGGSHHNKAILKLLLSEKINKKGKLFTVIGRSTFSAAQNLASDIEYYTEAIFIGEPTGSSPNFIGETNPFKLPYSGLVISSSNVYHQRGLYSSDTRKWKAPDIYKEFSFKDFKHGIDPVLDEIIEYKKNRSEK